MVGRGIALPFHDRGTRRGWVVSSTPRPHFTPAKDPVPVLQEAGWVPGPAWTGGKSHPHRDSIPDRPARSSVAIPTELPGLRIYRVHVQIVSFIIRVSVWSLCQAANPLCLRSKILIKKTARSSDRWRGCLFELWSIHRLSWEFVFTQNFQKNAVKVLQLCHDWPFHIPLSSLCTLDVM